jgi:uncharacterized protein (DUF697 family)
VSSRIGPLYVLKVLREFRGETADTRPLVVAGAKELVPLLAKELRAGGYSEAVREGGSVTDASALIWLGPADKKALREASLAKVPIVGVTDGESLPYVLDTAIVTVPAGRGFPIDEIAAALARQLRERGTTLAARLPVLRDAFVDELIRTTSRHNAVIAVGIVIPGVGMPVLTLNQIRLVLRIARVYGRITDSSLAPEVLGVVGAGLGWRTLARELLDFAPVGGWAVKGGIAYTGTRAIGEAARRFYAARAPSGAGPTLPA